MVATQVAKDSHGVIGGKKHGPAAEFVGRQQIHS